MKMKYLPWIIGMGIGALAAGARSTCPPNPLPQCTTWGQLISSDAPICCEENVTSCRNYNADTYQCMLPKNGIGYQNGHWASWQSGYNCDGNACY